MNKSTIWDQDVCDEIITLAKERFDHLKNIKWDVFYEHDRWWVRAEQESFISLYSVVDCQDKYGHDYLDLEEIDTVEI